MIRKYFFIMFLFMGFCLESYSQHLSSDFVGTWRLFMPQKSATSGCILVPGNSWKVVRDDRTFYQVRKISERLTLSHEGTYRISLTQFVEKIEKCESNKSWEGRTNYIPFLFINENLFHLTFVSSVSGTTFHEYWMRVDDLDMSRVEGFVDQ